MQCERKLGSLFLQIIWDNFCIVDAGNTEDFLNPQCGVNKETGALVSAVIGS